MDKTYLQETQKWIREELDIVANFWLKNGIDREHGGVYTCLDRTGRIYSTDKSVWMQGRCGWIYSYLCHLYGARPEWLEASKSCLTSWRSTASTPMLTAVCTSPSPLTASLCVSAATTSLRHSTASPTLSTTASPATRSI